MSIDEAAKTLTERFVDKPWFIAVGIGKHEKQPCLYLYVTSLKEVGSLFACDNWHGFHVEVVKMGRPRPSAA